MIFDFTTSAPKPHDLESALQLIAEVWINGAKLTAELTAQKEKLNTIQLTHHCRHQRMFLVNIKRKSNYTSVKAA